MHRYVIERDLPKIGSADRTALREGSQRSNQALAELGPNIQWRESFVTDDKIYCIYLAENEDIIREHAKRSGFPASRISEVRQVIDPLTAT